VAYGVAPVNPGGEREPRRVEEVERAQRRGADEGGEPRRENQRVGDVAGGYVPPEPESEDARGNGDANDYHQGGTNEVKVPERARQIAQESRESVADDERLRKERQESSQEVRDPDVELAVADEWKKVDDCDVGGRVHAYQGDPSRVVLQVDAVGNHGHQRLDCIRFLVTHCLHRILRR